MSSYISSFYCCNSCATMTAELQRVVFIFNVVSSLLVNILSHYPKVLHSFHWAKFICKLWLTILACVVRKCIKKEQFRRRFGLQCHYVHFHVEIFKSGLSLLVHICAFLDIPHLHCPNFGLHLQQGYTSQDLSRFLATHFHLTFAFSSTGKPVNFYDLSGELNAKNTPKLKIFPIFISEFHIWFYSVSRTSRSYLLCFNLRFNKKCITGRLHKIRLNSRFP